MLNKLIFLILILISETYGHSYHAGECPIIHTMDNFDMEKFLGKWYAIEKTVTRSSCLEYDLKRGERSGLYELEQMSRQRFEFGSETHLSSPYVFSYTGEITMPEDKRYSDDMRIKFPLNLAGSASIRIFDTDYKSYAGLYTCQKLLFLNRQSVTVLSRNITIDDDRLKTIHSHLTKAGIDVDELDRIDQSDCYGTTVDDREDLTISIKPDMISAINVLNKIRQTTNVIINEQDKKSTTPSSIEEIDIRSDLKEVPEPDPSENSISGD